MWNAAPEPPSPSSRSADTFHTSDLPQGGFAVCPCGNSLLPPLPQGLKGANPTLCQGELPTLGARPLLRTEHPSPGSHCRSRGSCAVLDAGLVSCFYSGLEQLSSASCLRLAHIPQTPALPSPHSAAGAGPRRKRSRGPGAGSELPQPRTGSGPFRPSHGGEAGQCWSRKLLQGDQFWSGIPGSAPCSATRVPALPQDPEPLLRQSSPEGDPLLSELLVG